MEGDRDVWNYSTFKVVIEFDEDRRDALKDKRSKRKLKLPQTLHRTLLSPLNTAYGPTFPALDSSIMSVPAGDVCNLPNLRLRN